LSRILLTRFDQSTARAAFQSLALDDGRSIRKGRQRTTPGARICRSGLGCLGASGEAPNTSKELSVRYVLEGSVQRSPEKIRINAQLIGAITNGHVWEERFDGSPSDIFALQDKVTGGLASALAIQLTAEEEQSLAQRNGGSGRL
jgi:hypothetical protein